MILAEHMDGSWHETMIQDWSVYPGETEAEKVIWANDRIGRQVYCYL